MFSHTCTHAVRGQRARGRNRLSAGVCLAGWALSGLESTGHLFKQTISVQNTDFQTLSWGTFRKLFSSKLRPSLEYTMHAAQTVCNMLREQQNTRWKGNTAYILSVDTNPSVIITSICNCVLGASQYIIPSEKEQKWKEIQHGWCFAIYCPNTVLHYIFNMHNIVVLKCVEAVTLNTNSLEKYGGNCYRRLV